MSQINWKLDIGSILTILVLLVGMSVGWGTLEARMSEVETEHAQFRNDMVKIYDRLAVIREDQIRTEAELKLRQEMEAKSTIRR
jgi:hypothetical protein